jgi:sortase A
MAGRSLGVWIVWWMLALIVGLAAWTLLFAFWLSGVDQARSQQALYATMRQNLASATAPLGGAISPGTPVAVMAIPSIGVKNLVAVEGTTSAQLMLGPGHMRSTPLPGQAGVSVLLGRATTFGGPFGKIVTLTPGAPIEVTTQQGTFTYHVLDVRRPGDHLPQPLASGKGRLVLVTSEGTGWRAGWAPQYAVFVDADLAGKTQPGVGQVTIGSNEQIMAGDTSGLISLVFLLQAALAVSVGIVWSSQRWGRLQTWIVGAPLALWVLWELSLATMRLMPNLL